MGHGVSRDKQRKVARPRTQASRSSSQDSSLDAFNKWPPSDPHTPIDLPSDDENWALEYPWAWAYENEDPLLAVKREREYFQALYQSSIDSDAEAGLHEAVAALTKRRHCRGNPVSSCVDERYDDFECSDWESYAESETLASVARQQREELERVCQLWSEDESSVDPPSSALIATVSSKGSFSWKRPSLSPIEFPISYRKAGLDGSPVDLLDIKDDPCLLFGQSLTARDRYRSSGVYTFCALQTSDQIYKMDNESSVDSPTMVTRMLHELDASCEASGTSSPGESSVDLRVEDTDVLANGRVTSTDADKLSDVDRFGRACDTFVFFKPEDCLHITRHQPSPEKKRETSSRSEASCDEADEDEEDEKIECFDAKGNIPIFGESSVNDATSSCSRLSLLQGHPLRRSFLPTDHSPENGHWSDHDMMLVATGEHGVNVPVQSHSTQEARAACFEIGRISKSTGTIYDNNTSRSVEDNSSPSEGFLEIFRDVCNNRDVDKISIDGEYRVYQENVSAISTETLKRERSDDDDVIDNAVPFCAEPDHMMSSIDNDAFMYMSVSDVECDVMDPRSPSDTDANDPRSLSDMVTSSTTDVSSGTISPSGDFITDEAYDESMGFLSHTGITPNRLNTRFQQALDFAREQHCFGGDTQQIAASIETPQIPMCEIASMLPDFLVEHPISHQAPMSPIASMNVTEADKSGEESLARDQVVYNHNEKAAKARTNSRQLTEVLPVDWSLRSQSEDEIVAHYPADGFRQGSVPLETLSAVSSTSQLTTTLSTSALCETFGHDLQAFPHEPLYLLGSDLSGELRERISGADEHRQGSPHQSESLQSTKSGDGFTSAIKDLSEDHLRASSVTSGQVYMVRGSDENYQESSVDESAEVNIEKGRENLQTNIPGTALTSDIIREDVLKDIPGEFENTAQEHLPNEYCFEDRFGDLCKYESTGTRSDDVSSNTSVRSSMISDDSSVDAWSDTSSSKTVILVDGVPVDPTGHRRSETYDDFIALLDNGDRDNKVGSFHDDHMGEADELDSSMSVSLKRIEKLDIKTTFFRWDEGAALEQGKSGDEHSHVKSCEEFSQEDDSGDVDHENQLRIAHLLEARMAAESISEPSAALLKPGQLLDRIIALTPNMAWSTNSSSRQDSLPEYNLGNKKADGQNIYTNQDLDTALDTARWTSDIVVASDSIRMYNATSHTADTIYSSAAGDNNTTIPQVMQVISDIADETITSVNEGTLCEVPGKVKGEHDATESEENCLDLKQNYIVSVPPAAEDISSKHQIDALQMADKNDAASLDVKQTVLPEKQEKLNMTKENEKIIDKGVPEGVVSHTSNNTFCEDNTTSPEVINDTFPTGPNKLAEVEASEREGDIEDFIEVNTEVLESVEDVVGIEEPRNIIEADNMVTEDKSETQIVTGPEKTTDTKTSEQGDVTKCEEPENGLSGEQYVTSHEKLLPVGMTLFEKESGSTVLGGENSAVLEMQQDMTVPQEPQLHVTSCEELKDSAQEREDLMVNEKPNDIVVSEGQGYFRVFENLENTVMSLEEPDNTAASEAQSAWTKLEDSEDTVLEKQNVTVLEKPKDNAASEGQYSARSFEEQNCIVAERKDDVTVIEKSKYTAVSHKQDRDTIFQEPEETIISEKETAKTVDVISKLQALEDVVNDDPHQEAVSEGEYQALWPKQNASLCEEQKAVNLFGRPEDASPLNEDESSLALQLSKSVKVFVCGKEEPENLRMSEMHEGVLPSRTSISLSKRSEYVEQFVESRDVKSSKEDDDWSAGQTEEDTARAGADSRQASAVPVERQLPADSRNSLVTSRFVVHRSHGLSIEVMNRSHMAVNVKINKLQTEHVVRYQFYDPHPITLQVSQDTAAKLNNDVASISEFQRLLPGEDVDYTLATDMYQRSLTAVPPEAVDLTKVLNTESCKSLNKTHSLEAGDGCIQTSSEQYQHDITAGPSLEVREGLIYPAATITEICGILTENSMASEASWQQNNETAIRHEEELPKVLLGTDAELTHRTDSPALAFSEVTLLTTRDDVEYSQVPVSATESYIEDMEADFEKEPIQASDFESHEEDRTADNFLEKEAFTLTGDERANESETESSEFITNCLVNATLLVAQKEDITEGLLRTEKYEAESSTDWSRESPLTLPLEESVQYTEGVNQVSLEAYEDQEIEIPACDWIKDVPVAIPLEDGRVQKGDDNLVWEPYEKQEINKPAFDQSEEMPLTMSVKDKEEQEEEGDTLTPGSYNKRVVDKAISECSEEVALDTCLDDQEKVKGEVERSVLLDCKTAIGHKDQLQGEVSTTDTELMHGPENPAFVPFSDWSEKIENEGFIMMVKDETRKEDRHIVPETCAARATDIATVERSQNVLSGVPLDDDAEHQVHFDTKKAVIRGDEVQRNDSLMSDEELVQRSDTSASVSRQVSYLTPRNNEQNHTYFAEDAVNVDMERNEEYKDTSFAEDTVEVSKAVSFAEGIALSEVAGETDDGVKLEEKTTEAQRHNQEVSKAKIPEMLEKRLDTVTSDKKKVTKQQEKEMKQQKEVFKEEAGKITSKQKLEEVTDRELEKVTEEELQEEIEKEEVSEQELENAADVVTNCCYKLLVQEMIETKQKETVEAMPPETKEQQEETKKEKEEMIEQQRGETEKELENMETEQENIAKQNWQVTEDMQKVEEKRMSIIEVEQDEMRGVEKNIVLIDCIEPEVKVTRRDLKERQCEFETKGSFVTAVNISQGYEGGDWRNPSDHQGKISAEAFPDFHISSERTSNTDDILGEEWPAPSSTWVHEEILEAADDSPPQTSLFDDEQVSRLSEKQTGCYTADKTFGLRSVETHSVVSGKEPVFSEQQLELFLPQALSEDHLTDFHNKTEEENKEEQAFLRNIVTQINSMISDTEGDGLCHSNPSLLTEHPSPSPIDNITQKEDDDAIARKTHESENNDENREELISSDIQNTGAPDTIHEDLGVNTDVLLQVHGVRINIADIDSTDKSLDLLSRPSEDSPSKDYDVDIGKESGACCARHTGRWAFFADGDEWTADMADIEEFEAQLDVVRDLVVTLSDRLGFEMNVNTMDLVEVIDALAARIEMDQQQHGTCRLQRRQSLSENAQVLEELSKRYETKIESDKDTDIMRELQLQTLPVTESLSTAGTSNMEESGHLVNQTHQKIDDLLQQIAALTSTLTLSTTCSDNIQEVESSLQEVCPLTVLMSSIKRLESVISALSFVDIPDKTDFQGIEQTDQRHDSDLHGLVQTDQIHKKTGQDKSRCSEVDMEIKEDDDSEAYKTKVHFNEINIDGATSIETANNTLEANRPRTMSLASDDNSSDESFADTTSEAAAAGTCNDMLNTRFISLQNNNPEIRPLSPVHQDTSLEYESAEENSVLEVVDIVPSATQGQLIDDKCCTEVYKASDENLDFSRQEDVASLSLTESVQSDTDAESCQNDIIYNDTDNCLHDPNEERVLFARPHNSDIITSDDTYSKYLLEEDATSEEENFSCALDFSVIRPIKEFSPESKQEMPSESFVSSPFLPALQKSALLPESEQVSSYDIANATDRAMEARHVTSLFRAFSEDPQSSLIFKLETVYLIGTSQRDVPPPNDDDVALARVAVSKPAGPSLCDSYSSVVSVKIGHYDLPRHLSEVSISMSSSFTSEGLDLPVGLEDEVLECEQIKDEQTWNQELSSANADCMAQESFERGDSVESDEVTWVEMRSREIKGTLVEESTDPAIVPTLPVTSCLHDTQCTSAPSDPYTAEMSCDEPNLVSTQSLSDFSLRTLDTEPEKDPRFKSGATSCEAYLNSNQFLELAPQKTKGQFTKVNSVLPGAQNDRGEETMTSDVVNLHQSPTIGDAKYDSVGQSDNVQNLQEFDDDGNFFRESDDASLAFESGDDDVRTTEGAVVSNATGETAAVKDDLLYSTRDSKPLEPEQECGEEQAIAISDWDNLSNILPGEDTAVLPEKVSVGRSWQSEGTLIDRRQEKVPMSECPLVVDIWQLGNHQNIPETADDETIQKEALRSVDAPQEEDAVIVQTSSDLPVKHAWDPLQLECDASAQEATQVPDTPAQESTQLATLLSGSAVTEEHTMLKPVLPASRVDAADLHIGYEELIKEASDPLHLVLEATDLMRTTSSAHQTSEEASKAQTSSESRTKDDDDFLQNISDAFVGDVADMGKQSDTLYEENGDLEDVIKEPVKKTEGTMQATFVPPVNDIESLVELTCDPAVEENEITELAKPLHDEPFKKATGLTQPIFEEPVINATYIVPKISDEQFEETTDIAQPNLEELFEEPIGGLRQQIFKKSFEETKGLTQTISEEPLQTSLKTTELLQTTFGTMFEDTTGHEKPSDKAFKETTDLAPLMPEGLSEEAPELTQVGHNAPFDGSTDREVLMNEVLVEDLGRSQSVFHGPLKETADQAQETLKKSEEPTSLVQLASNLPGIPEEKATDEVQPASNTPNMPVEASHLVRLAVDVLGTLEKEATNLERPKYGTPKLTEEKATNLAQLPSDTPENETTDPEQLPLANNTEEDEAGNQHKSTEIKTNFQGIHEDKNRTKDYDKLDYEDSPNTGVSNHSCDGLNREVTNDMHHVGGNADTYSRYNAKSDSFEESDDKSDKEEDKLRKLSETEDKETSETLTAEESQPAEINNKERAGKFDEDDNDEVDKGAEEGYNISSEDHKSCYEVQYADEIVYQKDQDSEKRLEEENETLDEAKNSSMNHPASLGSQESGSVKSPSYGDDEQKEENIEKGNDEEYIKLDSEEDNETSELLISKYSLRYDQLTSEEGELKDEDECKKTEEASNSTEYQKYFLSSRKNEEGNNYERECDNSRNQRLSAEVDDASVSFSALQQPEKDTWDDFMHLPLLDDIGRHASEIAENLVNEVMETEKTHLESDALSEQGVDMQTSSDSVFFKDDLEVPASTVSQQISRAVETSKTLPSICSETLKTVSTLDLKKGTLPRADQTGSKEEDKGPGLTKDLKSSTAAVGPQREGALLERETIEKDTSNTDRTKTESDPVPHSCVSLMSEQPASEGDSTKLSSMLSGLLVKSDTEDTIVFDDSKAEEASLPVIDILPSEVDVEGDIPNDYDTPEFAHLLTYELATALTHEIVLMAEVEVAMEDMDDDSNSFTSDQDDQDLQSHELAKNEDSHLKETEGGGLVSSESEEDHLTKKLGRPGDEHISQSVRVSHEMHPLPTENTHETPETGSEATEIVNEEFKAEDEEKNGYVSDSICFQSLVYSPEEAFAPSSDDDTAFSVLDHDTTGEETLVMRRLKADKQGSTCQHMLEGDTDTVEAVRDEAHIRSSYTSVGSEETQGSVSEATTTSGEYIIHSRGSVASDDSEEQSTLHNYSDDIQSAEVYTDKQETVILPERDFATFSLELDHTKPKVVITSPTSIKENYYWKHEERGAAVHLSCDDWLQHSKENKEDVYQMKPEYRESLLMSLPAEDFRVSDIDDMENSSHKETGFSQVLSDLDLCADKQTQGNAAHSDDTPTTSAIRTTFEDLKLEALEAACEENDVGDLWIRGQNILFQKIVPSDEDKDTKVICEEESHKTIMGIQNKNDEENKVREIVADSDANVTNVVNTKDDLVRDNSVDVFTTQNKVAIIHCQQDADSESDSLHAEYDFVDSSDTENDLHDEDHFSKVSDDNEWEIEDQSDMSSEPDKNKAARMESEPGRDIPAVDMTTWLYANADTQPTGDIHKLIEDDSSIQEASCLESQIIQMPTQVITDSLKCMSCSSAESPAVPKESEITKELITTLTHDSDLKASEDAAASKDFLGTGSVALPSVEDNGSNFEAPDVLDVIEVQSVGDVLVDSDEVHGYQDDEKEAATALIPSSKIPSSATATGNLAIEQQVQDQESAVSRGTELDGRIRTLQGGAITQSTDLTLSLALRLPSFIQETGNRGLESYLTKYQHDNLPKSILPHVTEARDEEHQERMAKSVHLEYRDENHIWTSSHETHGEVEIEESASVWNSVTQTSFLPTSIENPITMAVSQPSIPYEQLIQFPSSNLCTDASVTEIPSKEVNGIIVSDDMTEPADKVKREKEEPKITTSQQSLSETEAEGTGQLASASKTVFVLEGTSSKDSGCLESASQETGKKKKKQKKKIPSALMIETANIEEDKSRKPTTAAHSGSGVLQTASPFTPAVESQTSDEIPKVTVFAKRTKKKKKSFHSQSNDPTTEHKGELQLTSSNDRVAHFFSHVQEESVPSENFTEKVSTAFELESHTVSLSACKSSGDVKTLGDLTSQPGSHISVKEEQRILTEQQPKEILKLSARSTAAFSMPKRDQTSAHASIINLASHSDPVLPFEGKTEGHSVQSGVDTHVADKSTSSRRRRKSSRRDKQPLETQQQPLCPSSSKLEPHVSADTSGPFQRGKRRSQRHPDNASDLMLESSPPSGSCRRQEDPSLGFKDTSEGKRLQDGDNKDFGVAMARLSVLTGMRKKRKRRNNIVVVEQSRRF